MKKADINKLESFKEWVDSLVEQLEEQIDAREDKYWEHSEAWRDSEKGEAYDSKTEDMTEDKEYMENIASAIEDILNKYN